MPFFKVISVYCRPSPNRKDLFNSIVIKEHYEEHSEEQFAKNGHATGDAMPLITAGLSTDYALLNWYTFPDDRT